VSGLDLPAALAGVGGALVVRGGARPVEGKATASALVNAMTCGY
jgi:hypothetical protein